MERTSGVARKRHRTRREPTVSQGRDTERGGNQRYRKDETKNAERTTGIVRMRQRTQREPMVSQGRDTERGENQWYRKEETQITERTSGIARKSHRTRREKRYHKEETQNVESHTTAGTQSKHSNNLCLPPQDDGRARKNIQNYTVKQKLERKFGTTPPNKDTSPTP